MSKDPTRIRKCGPERRLCGFNKEILIRLRKSWGKSVKDEFSIPVREAGGSEFLSPLAWRGKQKEELLLVWEGSYGRGCQEGAVPFSRDAGWAQSPGGKALGQNRTSLSACLLTSHQGASCLDRTRTFQARSKVQKVESWYVGTKRFYTWFWGNSMESPGLSP